jgi:hypothetical protein
VGLERMLLIHFLQQWNALSDPGGGGSVVRLGGDATVRGN